VPRRALLAITRMSKMSAQRNEDYPELLLNSGRISNSPMSAVSPPGDHGRRTKVAGSGD
jgi:hypothetical protein